MCSIGGVLMPHSRAQEVSWAEEPGAIHSEFSQSDPALLHSHGRAGRHRHAGEGPRLDRIRLRAVPIRPPPLRQHFVRIHLVGFAAWALPFSVYDTMLRKACAKAYVTDVHRPTGMSWSTLRSQGDCGKVTRFGRSRLGRDSSATRPCGVQGKRCPHAHWIIEHHCHSLRLRDASPICACSISFSCPAMVCAMTVMASLSPCHGSGRPFCSVIKGSLFLSTCISYLYLLHGVL